MARTPPRYWTKEELDFLRKNDGKLSYDELAAHLGRDRRAVSSKCEYMRWRRRVQAQEKNPEVVRERVESLFAFPGCFSSDEVAICRLLREVLPEALTEEEIAIKMGLPLATVTPLVRTLTKSGAIEKLPKSRQQRLGYGLVEKPEKIIAYLAALRRAEQAPPGAERYRLHLRDGWTRSREIDPLYARITSRVCSTGGRYVSRRA